jgi:uncharacterized sulfatase
MQRREFLAGAAPLVCSAQSPARPNILWVTCEDLSPNLGCYGDKFAQSPAIDALASRGLRYRHAWSNAPVCAPARTTIISGMYPPSTGAEHMRSQTKLAPGQKMFPQILREAGYYTSNNNKEDYNLVHTGKVWDDSSTKAHFRQRSAGQPFFSVFNFVITHESQIRRVPHELKHDPREVRVPVYHPDTPKVRHDWAQYYDNIVTMDNQVKKVLSELEADGLAQDTVVMFYSDHGAGMPRSKRWPYNSGCQVPMIAHFPEKFRHLAPRDYAPGAWTDRLVSFVDLAPTVLSLAGLRKPDYHQGHAFLGQFQEAARPYVFGFRGRMDERIDMVRSVRSSRYTYLRQYHPHRIYGQHVSYMFEMPTAQEWKRIYDEGKATPPQKRFWEPKPTEELYDLASDPDEVNNLALNPTPEQKKVLAEMRAAQRKLAADIKDIGFLPEHEIHARAGDDAPYAMGQDPKRYAAARIQAAAEMSTLAELTKGIADADSGVRYWAAIGLLRQAAKGVPALRKAMADASPNVQVIAAEAVARYGDAAEQQGAIELLLRLADAEKNGPYLAVAALNSLSEVGAAKLKPYRAQIAALPPDAKKATQRAQGYVPRLLEYLLAVIERA